MKKSAKLSLALALMMGTTAGVQVMTNNASAEVSDKFRMELNGVTSYFHDTSSNYYSTQRRTDNTNLGKGWNNYTRVQLTYNVDKDVKAVARLHSSYDNAGDFAANKNTSGAYFDQSYIQYNDRKNNLHYIVGKKGMTLGQSMVYNSTGNLTGVQVSYGNFWDPTCFQLTYGDAKGGNRVWSAQLTKSTSKATSFNATYVRGESLYGKTTASLGSSGNVNYTYSGPFTRQTDSFIDFGGKVKFHGVTLVGEYARNQSGLNQKGKPLADFSDAARQAWFIELYTGPTNDFGSGLPLQKPGTHAFSARWQNLGAYGTYNHNNTFYDNKRGLRLDYGIVLKKGLAVDFVYGRMQNLGSQIVWDKTNRINKYDTSKKGDWSNIYVVALNYKFR